MHTPLSSTSCCACCCYSDPYSPLQGLPDSIAVNSASWKKIYDSLEPDHAPMPEPWRSDLSLLQKIVTLRMLRPDKLIPALTTFVGDSLGRRFVEPKPFAIEPSYNDSTCSTPLIFVLSPGRCGNSTTLYSSTCNTILSYCGLFGMLHDPTVSVLLWYGSQSSLQVCCTVYTCNQVLGCGAYVFWLSLGSQLRTGVPRGGCACLCSTLSGQKVEAALAKYFCRCCF